MMVEMSLPQDLWPPGRLSHALLHDFIYGDLAGPAENPFFSPCQQLGEPVPHSENGNKRTNGHELLLLPNQSHLISSQSDDFQRVRHSSRVSCICRVCRYQFVFDITSADCYGGVERAICHHLSVSSQRHKGPWTRRPENPQALQRHPIVAEVDFRCSRSFEWSENGVLDGPLLKCEERVQVTMLRPRLKMGWIHKMVDDSRIRERIRMAKTIDSDRFADMDENKMARLALDTLRAYLDEVLSREQPRRINLHNKRFYVQFGQDLDDMFEDLGFVSETEKVGGDAETKWRMPTLEFATDGAGARTSLYSKRAYLEIVKTEVESLIEQRPSTHTTLAIRPISATLDLEQALGSVDRTKWRGEAGRNAITQRRDAWLLGTTPDSNRDLIIDATRCQMLADPRNWRNYWQAGQNIANARGDQTLSMDLGSLYSRADSMKMMESKSQEFFTADEFDSERSDMEVFEAFLTRRQEKSIKTKLEFRKTLLRIAEKRGSDHLKSKALALDSIDVEEAMACFTELEGQDPQWIALTVLEDFAKAQLVKDIEERDGISLEGKQALTEAAFKRLAHEYPKNRKEGFEAVNQAVQNIEQAMIRTDQQPATMQQELSQSDTSQSVGLDNLRNTCYLNSILQYLYTVTAVRDFVLGSHWESLPATDETAQKLANMLAVESDADTPHWVVREAFLGNEFCVELQSLFLTLQTTNLRSVRPEQRLANAASLALQSLEAKKKDDKMSGKGGGTDKEDAQTDAAPVPPPLPPRDGSKAVPRITVDAVVESVETGSNVSSQTLVGDQTEDDQTYVIVKPGFDKLGNGAEAKMAELGREKDAVSDIEMTDVESGKSAEPAIEQLASGAGLEHMIETSSKCIKGGKQQEAPKLTVEDVAEELNKANVGTAQMDVDEVMTKVITHLQKGYLMRNGGNKVGDPIQAAFFTTTEEHWKRLKDPDAAWEQKKQVQKSVSAFPAPLGTNADRDIFEALEPSFGMEVFEGKAKYATIKEAAPHFHVLIQRANVRKEQGVMHIEKNTNYIDFPETIFLDRFIDAEPGSDLQKRQRRDRNLGARIGKIKEDGARPWTSESMTHSDMFEFLLDVAGKGRHQPIVPATPASTSWSVMDNTQLAEVRSKHANFQGDWTTQSSDTCSSAPTLINEETRLKRKEMVQLVQKMMDQRKEEAEKRQARLCAYRAHLFDEFQEHKYRLHALICHSGTTNAGHYWVWIRDFERNVWRKYNDMTVTECSESDFLDGHLRSKKDIPYYVCYVRDRDHEDLVSVPLRRSTAMSTPEFRDVEMGDAPVPDLNQAEVVHIEDAGNSDSSSPLSA